VVGDAGLRGFFGKELNAVLNEVSMKRRADVRRKAEEYGLDMSKREDRHTAAEEVLAEMAQSQPENSMVTKAVEAIRRALRKLYMAMPKPVKDMLGNREFVQWINGLSDGEIIDRFIVPARQYIKQGQDGGGAAMEPAFQRGDTQQGQEEPAMFSRAATDGTFGWGNDKTSKAPESEWAEENRRIRGKNQTRWNKAQKFLKRQFAPAGLLPDSVWRAKVSRDSQFEAVEFDSRHLIGELERAIKDEYGTTAAKLSPRDQQALSDALAGRIPADRAF
jgi:hypothetical protein